MNSRSRALILLFLIGSASGAMVGEDFEDDTAGQDPTSPWYTYSEGTFNGPEGNKRVQAGGLQSTNQTYRFSSTSGAGGSWAFWELDQPSPVTNFTFYVQHDLSSDRICRLDFFGEGNSPGASSNDAIWFMQLSNTAGTVEKLSIPTIGEVYDETNLQADIKVAFLFDWSSEEVTTFIDDIGQGTASFYNGNTAETLVGFQWTRNVGNACSFYFDEITVDGYNLPVPPGGTFANDRPLSSLWVDLENPWHIWTRETNNGDLLGGEGRIYVLDKDLTTNTTRNPCSTPGFPGANELAGVGYAPRGLQVTTACSSTDGSDDYQFVTINAHPSNGTYLADVNRGVVESEGPTGSSCTLESEPWWALFGPPGQILIGLDYAFCEQVGTYEPTDSITAMEWGGAWGGSWVGYDASGGELQEVLWTEDGPFAIERDTTLDTDPSTSQLSVDMRSGFYAYIDTTNGLTIREHVQASPLLSSPSTTGKAVALSFCEAGCPYAAPPKLDNSSYLWLIDGTSLERYSYNFNTNTLTLQDSATTDARQLRLSWDREYLLAWDTDTIYVYGAQNLTLLAALASGEDFVQTAHMDLGNNYVYALSGPGFFAADTVERFNAYNFTESLFGDGGPGVENPAGPGGAELCNESEVSCGPDSAAGDQCCDGGGSLGRDYFDGGFLNDPIIPGDPDLDAAGDIVIPGGGETAMRWLIGIGLIIAVTVGAVKVLRTRLVAAPAMSAGWIMALFMGLVPLWSIVIAGTLSAGTYAASRSGR